MTIPARASGGLIVLLAAALVRLLDGNALPMYSGLPRLLIAAVGVAGLLIVAGAVAGVVALCSCPL